MSGSEEFDAECGNYYACGLVSSARMSTISVLPRV